MRKLYIQTTIQNIQFLRVGDNIWPLIQFFEVIQRSFRHGRGLIEKKLIENRERIGYCHLTFTNIQFPLCPYQIFS